MQSFLQTLISAAKPITEHQTDLTRTGIISNSYNEMFEA
jgi:hypothetical protein